jgi:hypothetical protein
LHTLFLRPVIRDARGPLANALNGQQFSQVQNLIIAARDAQFILRCCPSARVVVAKYRMFEELDLLGALHESCHNLEELDGFNPDAATMQRTFSVFLRCGFRTMPEIVDLVRVAHNLRKIRFIDWIETVSSFPLKHFSGSNSLQNHAPGQNLHSVAA